MNTSVVIPALNAERYLPELIRAIRSQKPAPPGEILVLDSGSTDRTRAIAESFEGVRVIAIDDFSHGRARNRGAREARGDVAVYLSQDALPANEEWLTKLLEPFSDERVAAVYSRQIPRDDANPMERFFLQDRFPPGDPIHRRAGGRDHLTMEQVFFSNVSAAIRRDRLAEHPFDEEVVMSEDQQLSRDLMMAGYTVVYRPDSIVYHSHNYTLGTVFRRYFDSVYSLTQIFPRHGVGTSTAMGTSYLRREIAYMVRRYPAWLPYYAAYTFCKIAGALASHMADRMPRGLARRCSLHPYYWDAVGERRT